jgi:hypothetical protein
MSKINNVDFYKNQINKYLSWLSESDNNRLSTIATLSYSGFYNLGKAGLMDSILIDIYNTANKGVLCVLLALDICLDKIDIKQSRGNNNELILFPTDEFFNLLFIAQNPENYTKFAAGFIEYDHTIRQKRGKVIYDYPELFLALSYYILNDIDKCKEHLSRAQLAKKPAGMLKGYHEMIEGILEKNIDKIKLGIETHLKWFNRDRESRDSVGFPYNFSVMGFINFARYNGITVEFVSPNIHPDLIKELPKSFEFEGIPEVYEAIRKSEKNSKGLFGKLKNIFG